MCLTAKKLDELSARELFEILKVRARIIVVEQNCAYQDPDDTDLKSLHMFYRSGDRIAAYLRAFPKEGEDGVIQLGRVLTAEHGIGLGGKLLHESILYLKEKENVRKIYIEAQCYAAGFYEREGFVVCSDEFLEDGIPHVKMELLF